MSDLMIARPPHLFMLVAAVAALMRPTEQSVALAPKDKEDLQNAVVKCVGDRPSKTKWWDGNKDKPWFQNTGKTCQKKYQDEVGKHMGSWDTSKVDNIESSKLCTIFFMW